MPIVEQVSKSGSIVPFVLVGGVKRDPRNNRLDFGGDLDLDLDRVPVAIWIRSTIRIQEFLKDSYLLLRFV